MTLDRALALCREKRPGVAPIPAFMDQLQRYEIQCREDGLIMSNKDGDDEKSKRGDGRDTEGKTLDSKKRKVLKTCAIGPSLPSSSKRRVIQPSLPEKPNEIGERGVTGEGETVHDNGGNERSVGKDGVKESLRQVTQTTPSSTRQASIGPSLPPGFKRH